MGASGGSADGLQHTGYGPETTESQSPNSETAPAEAMTDRKLSLADIERKRSRPVSWVIFIVALLVAIIAPYGIGRSLAVRHTQTLIAYLDVFEPRGIAFLSWTAAFIAIVSIAMCVIEARSWTWRVILLLSVAAEQFIAGLCLLKMSFWYSTYVVFGDSIPGECGQPRHHRRRIRCGGVRGAFRGDSGSGQEGLTAEHAHTQLGRAVGLRGYRGSCSGHRALRWPADDGVIHGVIAPDIRRRFVTSPYRPGGW